MFVNKGFYDNRKINVDSSIHNPPYSLKSIDGYIEHVKKLATLNENDFDGDFDEMTIQEFRESIKEIYINNIDDRVI